MSGGHAGTRGPKGMLISGGHSEIRGVNRAGMASWEWVTFKVVSGGHGGARGAWEKLEPEMPLVTHRQAWSQWLEWTGDTGQ